jgi:hypothetical protein
MKRSAVLALFLSVSGCVFGSSGAYYSGHSLDKYHFALYLDGEFMGQNEAFLTIRPSIRILKHRREVKTVDNCLFIYNPDNHEQDRIECAENSNSRLSGVIYLQNKKLYRKSHGEIAEMVCVQRCSSKVPRVLRLTSEEDNC